MRRLLFLLVMLAVPRYVSAQTMILPSGASQFPIVIPASAVNGAGVISTNLTFSPDNTYDIGAASANRPRTVYAGTSFVAGSSSMASASIVSGGGVTASPASGFIFSGQGRLTSPADGVFQAANAALTGVTRLILGTNDATANGVSFVLNGGNLKIATGDGTTTAAVATNVYRDFSGNAMLSSNGTTASFGAGMTNIAISKPVAQFNGISTAGTGIPAIFSESVSSTQTANFTAATYTPPASAGRYVVSAVITTTSSTNTGTVQITVDYKDSQGTAHTADIIPLVDAAGSIATTKSGASKEFHTIEWKITIDGSATNIVLKVVTSGTVSYTVSPSIKQEA